MRLSCTRHDTRQGQNSDSTACALGANRSHAVNEIACLDDRQDFVPVLEKLAKTDPVHWKGREHDGVDGAQFYRVRFDARRALREIQNNQPCSWRRH